MKIKNATISSGVWAGQTIAAGSYYTIPQAELHRWQNDSTVLADLSSGSLLLNDDTNDIPDVATAINFLLGKDTTPKDVEGSPILRQKAAKAGWYYQLHGLEFTTSTIGGFHNKDKDGNDLGFVSMKLYDINGTEITDQPTADSSCVKTQIDWMVNHEMEIIGASLFQNTAPATDIRLWVVAAPGIANLNFVQGGANLKFAGTGHAINADGRVAKYLHPSIPMAGVNKFRMVLKHDAGIKHGAMFLFDLFRP
jgi:hypothetical protein